MVGDGDGLEGDFGDRARAQGGKKKDWDQTEQGGCLHVAIINTILITLGFRGKGNSWTYGLLSLL